jgi:hypothetical protein
MGGVSTGTTTPASEKAEQDLSFNPKENEEQFAKKMFGKLRGSMRRRHETSD